MLCGSAFRICMVWGYNCQLIISLSLPLPIEESCLAKGYVPFRGQPAFKDWWIQRYKGLPGYFRYIGDISDRPPQLLRSQRDKVSLPLQFYPSKLYPLPKPPCFPGPCTSIIPESPLQLSPVYSFQCLRVGRENISF